MLDGVSTWDQLLKYAMEQPASRVKQLLMYINVDTCWHERDTTGCTTSIEVGLVHWVRVRVWLVVNAAKMADSQGAFTQQGTIIRPA